MFGPIVGLDLTRNKFRFRQFDDPFDDTLSSKNDHGWCFPKIKQTEVQRPIACQPKGS